MSSLLCTVDGGENERFGVEGFSIIIFCVIMIIFSSSFFLEIVYVCSEKSTLKVKFIFLYQWVRSENVFIRIVKMCMRGWKKKAVPMKDFFICFSVEARIWKLRVDSISRNNCFCCATFLSKKKVKFAIHIFFRSFCVELMAGIIFWLVSS